MSTTVTRYTVLLSAPGDTKAECAAADEELQKINRTHSAETGVEFYATDWRRDSRADSGDEPQKLLNRQIVEGADIILAIFKEHFGTPTKDYGSGTEEEIGLGLSLGKTVLVYFWAPPADFTPKDPEQFAQIGKLRSSLQNRAMYKSFETEDDLRSKITHDFTKLLFELEGGTVAPKPQLSVQGVSADDQLMTDRAELVYPLVGRKLNATVYDSEVRNALSAALKFKLDPPAKPEPVKYSDAKEAALGGIELPPSLSQQMKKLSANWASMASTMPKSEKVVIPEAERSIVLGEAADLDVAVTDSLFDVGDLMESEQCLPSIYGSQEKMRFGTDKEKKKYELLQNLIATCKLRKSYRDYLKESSSIGGIALVVTNAGGSPAHHVNVEIKVPSSCVVRPNKIPLPSSYLVGHGFDTQAACEDLIAHIYQLKETPQYKDYDDSLVRTESGAKVPPVISTFSGNPLGGERYLDAADFSTLLEYVFGDYRFVYDSRNDITLIRITFDGLQQCTSYAFPTRMLIASSEISSLTYQIVADEVDKPVEGELTVNMTPTGD